MAGRDKRLLLKAGNEIVLEIERKKVGWTYGSFVLLLLLFACFQLSSPVLGFADIKMTQIRWK